MQDHAWCLTPMLQGSRDSLEVWSLNFLVMRVWYVSRSNTLDLKEISQLSFEHCYQLHTPRESWNHRNMHMAGHRIFRCQILTLSKVWGKRTEAPWNPTHAHMFSFFLASRIEIGKWILRLPVQHVSGGHIPSCNSSICVFEVILVRTIAHTRPLWFLLDQCSDFALFSVARPCHPKLARATTEMWPPGKLKFKIHFTISNLDARKKLNTWTCVEFQGTSVGWPQILLNVNIWQRKTRYAAI